MQWHFIANSKKKKSLNSLRIFVNRKLSHPCRLEKFCAVNTGIPTDHRHWFCAVNTGIPTDHRHWFLTTEISRSTIKLFAQSFIFIIPSPWFPYYFKKPTKCTNHSTMKHIAKHFISCDNPYILRHQGAIIREFINNKRSFLHVSAIHPGHLQGATGLVYVCSVYGNLSRITGTLHKWSITKTGSYSVRTVY